jgi:hypothetical protein
MTAPISIIFEKKRTFVARESGATIQVMKK